MDSILDQKTIMNLVLLFAQVPTMWVGFPSVSFLNFFLLNVVFFLTFYYCLKTIPRTGLTIVFVFQEENFHLENVYYSEMKDAGFFDTDWE